MARRIVRTVVVVLVVLGGLLAIAAGLHFYESEPMDDMRQRADVLLLPRDFVLVSESYSPGAMGFFGALPTPRTRLPCVMVGLVRFSARAWQPPGWRHRARAGSHEMRGSDVQ